MKKLLLLSVLALFGCGEPSTKTTGEFILPDDLQHCRVVKMSSGEPGAHYIYLIKCPPGTVPDGYIGASTTHPAGKSRQSNAVQVI